MIGGSRKHNRHVEQFDCFCVCSKNNLPVFHLNYERKDLALRVTVSNANGDDAYEAKLLATFPDTVSYSGVRSHQTVVGAQENSPLTPMLMF